MGDVMAGQEFDRGTGLSDRGQHNYDTLSPLINDFSKIIANTYDPSTNPEGVINAGIAENSLNYKELSEYYGSLDIAFTDLTYGDALGCSTRLQSAYAKLVNDRFDPSTKVTTDEISMGAGVGAVIDAILYNICDPKDAILIATPYYNGFDIDVTVRSSVTLVGVDVETDSSSASSSSGPFSHLAIRKLQDALDGLAQRGIKTKGVLFCNPHNPLGQCYPRSTVREYLYFCQRNDIWLLSDEIYALSVFGGPSSATTTTESKSTTTLTSHAAFHSVLSMTHEELDGFDKIVMMHGMSKDFCTNGIRVGCAITRHQNLHTSLLACSMINKISSLADLAFSKILQDTCFLNRFLDSNRRNLKDAYDFFTRWCDLRHVAYEPMYAGHFIILDLRRHLMEDSWEGESQLLERMVGCGVYVTPGHAYHFTRPGFFRWTFSMRQDYRDVALARLEKALEETIA